MSTDSVFRQKIILAASETAYAGKLMLHLAREKV